MACSKARSPFFFTTISNSSGVKKAAEMAIDLVNLVLDYVLPPAGLMFLAWIYPSVLFLRFWYRLFNWTFREDMYNKVVLITSAASGVGEKIAIEYAKKGAKLVLVAKTENSLREAADKCRRHGALDVRIISADVTRLEDCRRIVEETIRHFGRLDHLVNNVGLANSFMFDEASPGALHPSFDVTFWGNVYPTYYALPHLKQSKGRIVVTAAVAGLVPIPRMSMHNAAKASLVQFFETLRVEVGPTVGITLALPGWVESDTTEGKFVDAKGEERIFDTKARDMQVGFVPVAYSKDSAKVIVDAAVHRKWQVVVPSWYHTLLYYRIFAPQLLDGFLRFFLVQKMFQKEPPAKLALDTLGAKKVLYPASQQETRAASKKQSRAA